MKLTLDALEVLDAIDKKGSFAAAATALYRVPSTITYTVQKLEDDLGFVIFRREGRRSVLTPAGKVLLEQGRALLLSAKQIIESAHQVNSGWESTLNIAVDTCWDIDELYPIISEFYQLNTGVQINLFEEVMGGSLEAIIENRVDIVIGGPPAVINIQGIKFEQLMMSTWQFVVAKNHPLVGKVLPLKESDIKEYPSVVIRDSSQNSPIMPHRIYDKQQQLRVSHMVHKISALIQGVGVGFLPEHRIKNQLESGELVLLPLEKPAKRTPQFCSWRTNNKGKAMRWFIDKIVNKAKISYR
jgi:DNA-binding transcriptional LysR family regulator